MEVYLIGCHISNAEQLSLLRKLVDKLESNNKKFVLSSHTLLPDEIIKKSIGFVYDSVNPIYKSWDLDGKDKYCITTEFFQLWSKYISYGAPNYYHVGAIRLIQNGIRYIKSLDCKIVHWIEYDAEPLFMEEELNKKRLELCDFVFYGIGSKFSFNIDKVSEKFLSLRGEEVIKTLSNLNYVAEKLIDSYLIDGPKMFFDVEGKNEFMGKYSQSNKQKIDWCFFEKDEALNLFILNKVNADVSIPSII